LEITILGENLLLQNGSHTNVSLGVNATQLLRPWDTYEKSVIAEHPFYMKG